MSLSWGVRHKWEKEIKKIEASRKKERKKEKKKKERKKERKGMEVSVAITLQFFFSTSVETRGDVSLKKVDNIFFSVRVNECGICSELTESFITLIKSVPTNIRKGT